MKQQGVTYMEVALIAVSVFAAGVLLINKFVFEPQEKAEVSAEDRLKIQINALENKLKAYEGIETRFQDLEAENKKAWDTIDHIQNLAENGENFMKANEAEIKNIKDKLETNRKELAEEFKGWVGRLDRNVTVKLEEFKKPLAVALNQSRAQRPVSVKWKKYRGEDGKHHWVMTDKEVQYSRAEYLKKLKKQRGKSEGRDKASK